MAAYYYANVLCIATIIIVHSILELCMQASKQISLPMILSHHTYYYCMAQHEALSIMNIGMMDCYYTVYIHNNIDNETY